MLKWIYSRLTEVSVHHSNETWMSTLTIPQWTAHHSKRIAHIIRNMNTLLKGMPLRQILMIMLRKMFSKPNTQRLLLQQQRSREKTNCMDRLFSGGIIVCAPVKEVWNTAWSLTWNIPTLEGSVKAELEVCHTVKVVLLPCSNVRAKRHAFWS